MRPRIVQLTTQYWVVNCTKYAATGVSADKMTSRGWRRGEFVDGGHRITKAAAVSTYETGTRSPNLDQFCTAAAGLGYDLVLVPNELSVPRDPSELFSRLLYVSVAGRFLADPVGVRELAERVLARQDQTSRSGYYVNEWRRLLASGNEVKLLTMLMISSRHTTGLLSSSPFAGVLDEETRLELLKQSRLGLVTT